jgi:GntR family transcriptional regulator
VETGAGKATRGVKKTIVGRRTINNPRLARPTILVITSCNKQAKSMPIGEPVPAARTAQPLYARLRDQLKAEILHGRRKPGERLPSESEMTAEFGVSRITVRQALGDLQKEGLLVKSHGRGSFVSQPPVALDLNRLAGLTEALSGAGRTIHTRVLAQKPARADAEVAQALGLARGTQVSVLDTLRYLDRKPLVLNRSWMPFDIGTRIARADLASRDIMDILENELGMAIGRADLTIGAVGATAAQHRHLRVPAGTALVSVRRLVHDASDRPVHLEQGAYRADRFSYSLTLERARAPAPDPKTRAAMR